MGLILGRGAVIRASNVAENYMIWDVSDWDEANWAPSGSGALITIDGVASLVLLDDSSVEVDNGPLTFLTAKMVMTQGISSVSFQGQLLANFTVSIGEATTVVFTDASFSDGSGGGIVSWAWEFGDGDTSALQNPTHDYATYGDYIVTLTVTNTDGNKSTADLLIVVNPGAGYLVWDVGFWDEKLWASSLAPWPLRANQLVFEVLGPHPVSMEGTVNLSSNGSIECSPGVCQVITGGNIDTTAVVGSWGIDIDQATLKVENGGQLIVAGNDPFLDMFGAGGTVLLDINGGTLNLGMTSGDNADIDIGSGGNTVTVNILGTMTLQGNGEFNFGLSGSCTVTIALGATLLVDGGSNSSFDFEGDFNLTTNLTIPGNGVQSVGGHGVLGLFTFNPTLLSVAFADTSVTDGSTGSITGWAWDFGDSGTSTSQNPTHVYGSPGTYTVTLTVTTSGAATSVATNYSVTVT